MNKDEIMPVMGPEQIGGDIGRMSPMDTLTKSVAKAQRDADWEKVRDIFEPPEDMMEAVKRIYLKYINSPKTVSWLDEMAKEIIQLIRPIEDGGLREKIAKTCYQYAELIDDKDMDNYWKSLSLVGKNTRWLVCADQILKEIKGYRR